MKLMELRGIYFWFMSAEIRQEEIKPDIRKKCRSIAWEIADMLRSADDVDYLEDILDILFSPDFNSAAERDAAMGKLLEKLGHRINPRYQKKIQEIDKANMRKLLSKEKSNAPTSTEDW